MFAGGLLLIPLIIIMTRRIEELAAILFGRKSRSLLGREGAPPEQAAPFVSIHIPASRAAGDAEARLLIASPSSTGRISNVWW